MEKEFIPYELALKLKTLGFDEPCFGFYLEDGTWTPASYSREGTVYPSNTDLLPEWCAAPLYQQVFRWFREEHDLYYSILPRSTSGHRLSPTFNIAIYRYYMNMNVQAEILRVDGKIAEYADKEEAELACLDKLIEMAHPNN